MSTRQMIKYLLPVLAIFASIVSAYSWGGVTHKGITRQVEKKECKNAGECIANDYLENIGFVKGHDTPFPIYTSPIPVVGYPLPEKFRERWKGGDIDAIQMTPL